MTSAQPERPAAFVCRVGLHVRLEVRATECMRKRSVRLEGRVMLSFAKQSPRDARRWTSDPRARQLSAGATKVEPLVSSKEQRRQRSAEAEGIAPVVRAHES